MIYEKIVLVLHNIRSVHNVASIFRTANCAGVEKIYLCGITPSPVDSFGRVRDEFLKVSLGAERWVAWEKVSRIGVLLSRLRREKIMLYAVEQDENSVSYESLKNPASSKNSSGRCFIFGSETSGIPQRVIKLCDGVIEIPMQGKFIGDLKHPRKAKNGKESLNVAVAAGVVMFCAGQKSHSFYSRVCQLCHRPI